VGRHLVEAALRHGHDITLLHRGRTNPGLFPDAKEIRSDRDGGLDALGDLRWDAVVDTCGYVPRVVRQSAERLADRCDRYVFVSTGAVYADLSRPGVDESAPLLAAPDPPTEEVTGATYGALKAECERVVERCLPGRVLHVRAGLIVGPHDPTGRFTYWVARAARGGTIAAPGDPDRPVQLVDARDLAEWVIQRVEARNVGAYNATGPASPLTMRGLLAGCARAAGVRSGLRWIPDDVLVARGVRPFVEMPLWIPVGDAMAGVLALDCRKAIAAGLAFRPLVETARDTLAWHADLPPGPPAAAGMDPEREAELLAAAADPAGPS
jgi:2'-hydroxyisoflavone reductase